MCRKPGMRMIENWWKLIPQALKNQLDEEGVDKVGVGVIDGIYTVACLEKHLPPIKKGSIGLTILGVADERHNYCVPEDGVSQAIGRALGALKKEETYNPIRKNYELFSGGWRKSEMDRVINCPLSHKSIYFEEPICGGTDNG